MYKRPLHHELFLELLRSALWNKVPDSNLFRNIDESIWLKVMNTAQKQALLGVCYPALSELPSDCRPPQNIYLVWAAKANYIRQDNKKKLQVLSELLSLFEENGIYPVVMKGFSSAILYPEPDLRICGDIDLFIPDNYEKSLKLVSDLGYEMSETKKHHKFYYKGILIELHHEFINSPFKTFLQYGTHEVEFSGICIRTFEETTTAILLLTHFIGHIIGPGVGFRHLSDCILFFQKNHNKIDKICFSNYIKKNKLEHFVSIFNGLLKKLTVDDNLFFYDIRNGKAHPNDISILESDLFIQGDCGIEELFSRKSKCNLYVYSRVLIRFLSFFRYSPYITINMLLYRLFGK